MSEVNQKKPEVKKEEIVKTTNNSNLKESKTKKLDQELDFAKAGKRSQKKVHEQELKEEKELRKEQVKQDSSIKKPQIKTKSKLERRSKKYQEKYKLIDKSKEYTLDEAVELISKTSFTKFDASIEVHLVLKVDPKQSDQNIRDNLTLPFGTGKKVKVALFSDEPSAKKIPADIIGSDEILNLLDKGILNFDVLITTPALMPKLAKYARILGPRGLMPNPKSGTVTNDPEKAVNEAKAGKIEYRVDSNGIIHVAVGKVSFKADQLSQNIRSLMASVISNKPSSVKSAYLKSLYIATTMGPSIKVNLNSF